MSTETPIDPQEVQKLATTLHELVVKANPRMDVLMTALAETVVAFAIQNTHYQTGGMEHTEVTKRLSQFYSYAVDLASYKIPLLKAIFSKDEQPVVVPMTGGPTVPVEVEVKGG